MPPKRSSKIEQSVREPLNLYGLKEIQGATQLDYDRAAFHLRLPIDRGVPTRLNLFKRIANRINPNYFEWHSWAERMINAGCEYRWISISGCSNSSKTHHVAGFAAIWWLAAPAISSVIFCSTTAKALRKRGWANIQQFHTSIPGPRIGNFVDSRMMWQAVKGDDKHAIMGIAVEEGETTKVADNIKGVHTRRQMVIIDEATAVPPAITEACSNLYAYPREFIFIMMGNPRSRLDEFGKFIEPKNGWNSVSVEDEEWETTTKIDGESGICIRFDAEKSPNIVEGRLVSKHLPTKDRVESRKKSLGGNENDPTYWSNERGFPPPEGLNKNVFSETMLSKHDAYGTQSFTGRSFQIIGSLDPARSGGDRAVLRFAKVGEIQGGDWGIESGFPIVIKINAASTNPIDYQIAEQCERECQHVWINGAEYVCPPNHFGVDATGGGADLVDIMQRIWSADIMRILFSGAASEDACSHEDIRPANEVYRNKRAEMYFRAANAVKSGQYKGLDKETAKELVTIEFDDSKPKIVLMSKDDYRKKFHKSPDYSDAWVELLEVARRIGFKLAAVGKTVNKGKEFSDLVTKTQDVYSTIDYSEEVDLDYEMA